MDTNVVLQTLIMMHMPWIIGIMAALLIAALLACLRLQVNLNRLNKKYDRLMTGVEGGNLERILLKHLDDVRQAKDDIVRLDARCNDLREQLTGCIQRAGMIRFNAFDDTGSDLSYAIALLDEKNNGVVLSSIFGRSEARCYAKPIVSGQSTYFLTEEEKIAMQKALEKK